MSSERLYDILFASLFVIAQVALFRYLVFFGAFADIVFLYLFWLMTTRSRTEILVTAFAMGLFLDFFMDTWGLHIASKVLVVFILYNAIPRSTETKLDTWQVFLILLGAGLIHNFIFAGLAQFSEVLQVESFLIIFIGNSLYTAIIGSFIYIFKSG